MKLLKKILAPIDVSTDPTEQVNTIIKLANAYKSEITLMFVVGDQELDAKLKAIVKKSITRTLNEIKGILISHGVKVREPEVIFGNIVETIIQKATSQKANLILIGSKEKKKRAKFKLGIIAEQIIRESDIPVWLVTGEKKTIVSNILCPVDFSETSKRALTNAIELARKFNTGLKIMTVYEPLEYVSIRINVDLDEENAVRLKRAKVEMAAFTKHFDLNDVKHEIIIKSGKASEKILSTIRRQQIDLLIMGTTGRSGLSRFFMGSITEEVIREMPCSFLTIKNQT